MVPVDATRTRRRSTGSGFEPWVRTAAFLSRRFLVLSVRPEPSRLSAFLVVLAAFCLVLARLPPASAAPVTLNANADATAWNSQRKVARDSVGALFVALRVPDPDLGVAIRVFRSVDNGAGWSALPRLPDAASEMSRASLAVDGGDRVHLAWTELVGTDLQVFHAVWAGAWTRRTQVSFTPGYSGFPAIAVDRQDRLHLAWYGFDGSTYQVYYRVRSVDGTWGITETVSSGLQDANNPAIAVGPDDRPHVAWFLVTGARWSVVHTVRGARWAPIETLSNPANRALDPSLAVASDGGVTAAWTEESPNGTRAVVARISNASGWGPSTPLAWFTAPGGHPSVALDGRDRAFAFWDQLDAQIRYRTFSGTWGRTEAIAANGMASFPNARWAAAANPLFEGTNRIDVVWTEASAGSYAVGFGGVTVSAMGTPPPRAPVDLVPGLLAGAVLLSLSAVLWWRRRRIGRLGLKP